jgi:Ran GTPase-activating protein (RanGAP) involved in mRNA processing and transport
MDLHSRHMYQPNGQCHAVLQMTALQDNATVQTLYARHNKLGSLTGHALAGMLVKNGTLRHICLSWNAMGPTAGKAIAAGLGPNQALQVRRALSLA